MSDTRRLLEKIEEGITQHGGDLGGWTRLNDDALQLFEGRVTLRAEINEDGTQAGLVHAHVFTTLHEHDDEVLDACLFGMSDDRQQALAQVAFIWITCVAGPIRSFLENKPVCMTCQAGVQGGDVGEGYSPGDYGLPAVRAYVGPSFMRGFDDDQIQSAIDDTKPWFRFAAESAAPRAVHLAKATIISHGKEGWHRELEIDGHEVSHQESSWPAGVEGPEFGYLTRFAVFEFPRNSTMMARRAELDRTIDQFIQRYPQYESIDELMNDMVQQGFDAELVHEVESISTIAFGRLYFDGRGIQYSPTVIRARRNGSIEADVPVMSIPAYSRGRAVAARLFEAMSEDEIQSIGLYNAESHAILQALEAANSREVDWSGMKLMPCVVPDRGVSDETMNAALTMLHEMVERQGEPKGKPWWKFW